MGDWENSDGISGSTHSILVSNGETRTALAVVRALGDKFPVDVLAARPRSLASLSRSSREEIVVPDEANAPVAWSARVAQVLAERPGSILLPVTETAIGSIYQGGLGNHPRVIAPAQDAYERVVDKHLLLQLASEHGVRVPATILVHDSATLGRACLELGLPAVLKPRRSCRLSEAGWERPPVRILRDESDVECVPEAELVGGSLLQEFIAGTGEGLFLLVDDGQIRARFAHRRLREKPPSGGVSVLSESILPEPEVINSAGELLQSLGWSGVAMVEYRRTPSKQAILMEINPRLWGSLQLAVDSGVNFPDLLVKLHLGEVAPEPKPEVGMKLRWLLGDVEHLLIGLKRREMRRQIGRTPAQLVGAFVRSFWDGSRLEVLRWPDLKPGLVEWGRWLTHYGRN